MRLSHRKLFIISGSIWFAVGLFLMTLGFKFFKQALQNQSDPLIGSLTAFLGSSDMALVTLSVLALGLGTLKGRFVLKKTVLRNSKKLQAFQNPAPLSAIFTPSYLILVALMMTLGFLMRYFQVPVGVRGFIDVAVGSGLINGSMLYFRHHL